MTEIMKTVPISEVKYESNLAKNTNIQNELLKIVTIMFQRP